MDIIIRYIDELLDYFPINKITKKIRMDLLETTEIDYHELTQNGVDSKEASQQIISNIASLEDLAKVIPNSRTTAYYMLWAIGIAITVWVFNYVARPEFMQIFLPVKMEFPDIIEKYIHYFFIMLISYAGIYFFYRLLPQKWLNRTSIQSAIFLYTGTIMAALYFSIAIAFIWYTFNGFLPEEITFDLISTFIYTFYTIFFKSDFIVAIYAIINALMFVLSAQAYHLDSKPRLYIFEDIYTRPTSDQEIVQPINQPIVEEISEEPSFFQTLKEKVSFYFSRRKELKKQIQEPSEPTFIALDVTEEVISFLKESH